MENGVTITLREIYDLVQEVATGVRRLDARVMQLEEKIRETDEVNERSRQALQLAQDTAKDVEEIQKNITWFWRSIIGALIVGAIGALFYLAKGGN